MVTCTSLGALTFFYFDKLKMVSAINLATVFYATVAAAGTAIYFYNKALKALWVQVLALTLAAGLWVAAALALELSEVGRATPAIPLAVLVIDASYGFCLAIHFAKVEKRAPSLSSSGQQYERPNANARVNAKRKTTLTGGDKGGHGVEEGVSSLAFNGGGSDNGVDSATERSGDAQKPRPPRSIRPGFLAVLFATTEKGHSPASSPNSQNGSKPGRANGRGGGLEALASPEEKGSDWLTAPGGVPEASKKKSKDYCAGEKYNPWSFSDMISKATGEEEDLSASRTRPPTSGSLIDRVALPRSSPELELEASSNVGTTSNVEHTGPGPYRMLVAGRRVVPTQGLVGEHRKGAQHEHGRGSDNALMLTVTEDPGSGVLPPVQASPPRLWDRKLPRIVRSYADSVASGGP
eukprot:g18648.t1